MATEERQHVQSDVHTFARATCTLEMATLPASQAATDAADGEWTTALGEAVAAGAVRSENWTEVQVSVDDEDAGAAQGEKPGSLDGLAQVAAQVSPHHKGSGGDIYGGLETEYGSLALAPAPQPDVVVLVQEEDVEVIDDDEEHNGDAEDGNSKEEAENIVDADHTFAAAVADPLSPDAFSMSSGYMSHLSSQALDCVLQRKAFALAAARLPQGPIMPNAAASPVPAPSLTPRAASTDPLLLASKAAPQSQLLQGQIPIPPPAVAGETLLPFSSLVSPPPPLSHSAPLAAVDRSWRESQSDEQPALNPAATEFSVLEKPAASAASAPKNSYEAVEDGLLALVVAASAAPTSAAGQAERNPPRCVLAHEVQPSMALDDGSQVVWLGSDTDASSGDDGLYADSSQPSVRPCGNESAGGGGTDGLVTSVAPISLPPLPVSCASVVQRAQMISSKPSQSPPTTVATPMTVPVASAAVNGLSPCASAPRSLCPLAVEKGARQPSPTQVPAAPHSAVLSALVEPSAGPHAAIPELLRIAARLDIAGACLLRKYDARVQAKWIIMMARLEDEDEGGDCDSGSGGGARMRRLPSCVSNDLAAAAAVLSSWTHKLRVSEAGLDLCAQPAKGSARRITSLAAPQLPPQPSPLMPPPAPIDSVQLAGAGTAADCIAAQPQAAAEGADALGGESPTSAEEHYGVRHKRMRQMPSPPTPLSSPVAVRSALFADSVRPMPRSASRSEMLSPQALAPPAVTAPLCLVNCSAGSANDRHDTADHKVCSANDAAGLSAHQNNVQAEAALDHAAFAASIYINAEYEGPGAPASLSAAAQDSRRGRVAGFDAPQRWLSTRAPAMSTAAAAVAAKGHDPFVDFSQDDRRTVAAAAETVKELRRVLSAQQLSAEDRESSTGGPGFEPPVQTRAVPRASATDRTDDARKHRTVTMAGMAPCDNSPSRDRVNSVVAASSAARCASAPAASLAKLLPKVPATNTSPSTEIASRLLSHVPKIRGWGGDVTQERLAELASVPVVALSSSVSVVEASDAGEASTSLDRLSSLPLPQVAKPLVAGSLAGEFASFVGGKRSRSDAAAAMPTTSVAVATSSLSVPLKSSPAATSNLAAVSSGICRPQPHVARRRRDLSLMEGFSSAAVPKQPPPFATLTRAAAPGEPSAAAFSSREAPNRKKALGNDNGSAVQTSLFGYFSLR